MIIGRLILLFVAKQELFDGIIKRKTAKGLFWGGLNNGVQQFFGLLFGIILGRLLSPFDYGMIAVVMSNIVGVTLAWLGFSYWALATQSLVFVAVNTIMLWHYCKWRPTFKIDFTPVKRMFRFSCKILATTIFTQINNNVLRVC